MAWKIALSIPFLRITLASLFDLVFMLEGGFQSPNNMGFNLIFFTVLLVMALVETALTGELL